MKRHPRARALLYASVLVSLAGAQAPQTRQASLPVGSAVVVEAKGDIVVSTPRGAVNPVHHGQMLDAETRIETHKGSLLLTLQDGSQVLVEPNSSVILKVPDQSGGKYIQEMFGRVLAKIQKRLGVTPSFRMGTPTAVISVRGTQFEVSVTRSGKTTVDVYEGLVQVQGVAMVGPSVMLKPGYQTQVEPSGQPEPPTEIEERKHRGGSGQDSSNQLNGSPVFGGGGIAPGANGLNQTGEDSPQNPNGGQSGDNGDKKHEPH